MTAGTVPAELQTAILAAFPEFSESRFSVLGQGWHSIAIDVDDRVVFKFPRHHAAQQALIKEAALIAAVRPALTIAVPDLRLHKGPPLFSSHEKLHGRHLLAADYAAISEAARDQLATDIARFYAELHRLPTDQMTAAGAAPIAPWQEPAAMRAKALPALPAHLRDIADEIITAYENLPPDPLGMTYGFFDGHGWNRAFDHARQRLNGIYDFADSGLGSRHQEFIYTNLIARDLTARVTEAYEALTGIVLERERIAILTSAHRLSELAELADDPAHAPDMIRYAAEWLSQAPRPG